MKTWMLALFGLILLVLLVIDVRNYQMSQPVHTKRLANVALPKTAKPIVVVGKK